MGCKATETATFDAGEATDAPAGSILGYVAAGDNTVGRSSLSVPAAGVSIAVAAPGGQVTIISQGLAPVRLDGTDVVVTAGQTIYVSGTADGLGKVGEPDRARPLVGYVVDTTDYNAVTNPVVTALVMPENVLNRMFSRIAIGGTVTPTAGIAIGDQALVDTGDTDSIAIGRAATTTAANQCVVGSTAAPITDFRLVGNVGGAGGLALEVVALPAANQTGLRINVDRAGVLTAAESVGVGATDTGGLGFRALVVPN